MSVLYQVLSTERLQSRYSITNFDILYIIEVILIAYYSNILLRFNDNASPKTCFDQISDDLIFSFMSGMNERNFVIRKNTLKPNTWYMINITVNVENYPEPSQAAYTLLTNMPPYGGNCRVANVSGTVAIEVLCCSRREKSRLVLAC